MLPVTKVNLKCYTIDKPVEVLSPSKLKWSIHWDQDDSDIKSVVIGLAHVSKSNNNNSTTNVWYSMLSHNSLEAMAQEHLWE